MIVEYRGVRTSFDEKYCSNLSYDEFEAMCLGCKTFKLMQPKERMKKIKETYGNINGISKQATKDKHREDISRGGNAKRGEDSGNKQGTAAKGKKYQESKDNAKVQEPIIRKEKGEKES